MDPNYIPFHPNPSRPHFRAPPGTVDAHCHVFGPAERFPYAPGRKYTPSDAPKEKLFALRDFLGLSRNVIVQATCHGNDNRALVDALQASNGLARGIASVSPDIGDAELDALHEAGVRGVRFNFVKRLVDATPPEVFLGTARRIARLGWHSVVYFEAADLAGLLPFLAELPTLIVVDHMGRPDPAKGVDHADFRRFLDLMERNDRVWSKVTCPERFSLTGPPGYDDVVPFGRCLVERFPDRVLWGTDWPHPNMTTHAPDDGGLVDFIPRIAPTAALQQALLVDNPMRLYWS
ncbi:MAG: amidohydrolase family protein [Rhodospirillales bacterium]|nr:amidohydrolase family protein [Rhodospirillales bacterium]MDE2198010.1 amidohydrolase family protein [Rhodospirillales bacterium]MDE2574572.1 amidohydrolase family protein [Rhodospirillales bacterium]